MAIPRNRKLPGLAFYGMFDNNDYKFSRKWYVVPMGKNKKSKSKKPANSAVPKRFTDQAEYIFNMIVHDAPVGVLSMNLVSWDPTAEGDPVNGTHSIAIMKLDEDNAQVHIGAGLLPSKMFIGALARLLSHPNSSPNIYELGVAYSAKEAGWESSNELLMEHLEQPSTRAESWYIEHGEIIADDDINDTWGNLKLEPGHDLYGDDDDDDDDDAISDEAIEQSSEFLAGVFGSVPDGRSVLTIAGMNDSCQIFFNKRGSTVEMGEEESDSYFWATASNLDDTGHFAATLRTFTGKPGKNAVSEVRGWSVAMNHIDALTPDEIIGAYCTDSETGEPISPEPNVKYCDAWVIQSANTEA